MVAAANPRDPSIFERLGVADRAELRDALEAQAAVLGGVKGRRMRRIANDERQGVRKSRAFNRFVDRVYQRYLDEGGKAIAATAKAGSKAVTDGVKGFLQKALDWIKNNPQVILQIISIVLMIFGMPI